MASNSRSKALPRHGQETESILETLDALRLGDVQWREGRAMSLVSPGEGEVDELCREVYLAFFSEEGRCPAAFPSLRQLEAEVVSMTASLLGGAGDVVGNVTSGLAECALLAVKSARDWAREQRPKLTQPEVVLPQTAHPAFLKACQYLCVKPVLVAVDSFDLRADLKAVTKALGDRTVLVVGSAPTHPHGVVDPITELARLASRQGILCHVDASLGGFFLPFLSALDEPVTPFDLTIDGVTSISTDLHSYGAAAPSASVILYKDPAVRRHQYFATAGWPGGVYATPGSTENMPGGAVAAAWAVMHKLGFEGYRDAVRKIMKTTRAIERGIAAIEGLEVLGQPQMSIVAIGSKRHNVFELADHMAGRGWYLERGLSPPSLCLTIDRTHGSVVDDFLTDLRDAADATTQEPVERLIDRTRGLLLNTATRFLPKNIVNRVTSFAGNVLGMSTEELTISSVPLRGIDPSMPHGGDIETAALRALDSLTHLDPETADSAEPEEAADDEADQETED